ncbi:MAG: DUF308 domain-containing protein [Coprobacter sp.]|nr:DUF308 domain-containing protein [Coprobacter sp.]
MELNEWSYWGKSRYWWAILLMGIALIPCGLWLIFKPLAGYAVISMLLGWILVLLGATQLIVAGDIARRLPGWGWWFAGGIFDLFVGFLLVSNFVLSEMLLPYFFAFVLLYRGVKYVISGIGARKWQSSWWLYMLNGVLLMLLSLFFFFSPITATAVIVYLCAVAFIYWGITLIIFATDIKPRKSAKAV